MKLYPAIAREPLASLKLSCAKLAKWTPAWHAAYAAHAAEAGEIGAAGSGGDSPLGYIVVRKVHPQLRAALAACAEFAPEAVAFGCRAPKAPTSREMRSFDEFAKFAQPVVALAWDLRVCDRTDHQRFVFEKAVVRFAPVLDALAQMLP